ncbi:MAG: 50S ribosomal protein L10 [Anaerolineales bacterium]|nr:50S ribosomal protein L10 [Anaerolineales bacterium]QYK51473.1 MAG: 50S ribosomal protein L10 [Anaerolineales bacterium]
MALSKEKKQSISAQYEQWLGDAEAVFLTEYSGLSMPAFDELRKRIREVGGEFHVIKNTLGRRAFKAAGFDVPEADLLGSTAIGLAFSDAPGVAKALSDFAKDQEAVKIKSGFLGKDYLSKQDVSRLATLPALPVVRSQFLALLNTPATQLVRLLNEPGRRVAQVIKANAEKATA